MFEKIKKYLIIIFTFIFSNRYLIFLSNLFFYLGLSIRGYLNYGSFYRTGEKLIFQIIRENKFKNCLDIGANVGTYTKEILNISGTKVYSFEPLHGSFKELRKIQKIFKKRLKLYNYALGEKNTKKKIYFSNNYSQLASTIYNFKNRHLKKINSKTINVKKLDDFRNRIKNIDFIKIDVEGDEFNVLKGGLNFIKKNKVKIIQLEFNTQQIVKSENIYSLSQLMPQYEIFIIMPLTRGLRKINPLLAIENQYLYSNYLLINKKFKVQFKSF